MISKYFIPIFLLALSLVAEEQEEFNKKIINPNTIHAKKTVVRHNPVKKENPKPKKKVEVSKPKKKTEAPKHKKKVEAPKHKKVEKKTIRHKEVPKRKPKIIRHLPHKRHRAKRVHHHKTFINHRGNHHRFHHRDSRGHVIKYIIYDREIHNYRYYDADWDMSDDDSDHDDDDDTPVAYITLPPEYFANNQNTVVEQTININDYDENCPNLTGYNANTTPLEDEDVLATITYPDGTVCPIPVEIPDSPEVIA